MNCIACEKSLFIARRAPLVECLACGLVLDPAVWVPRSNERLNEEFFEPAGGRRGRFDRAAERLRNRRVWRTLAPHLTARARLLEIGVGSGAFLAYARSQGAQVAGCDLSAAGCAALRRQGIEAFHGPLEAMPAARFDAVVLMHVLEHTNAPQALLSAIRQRLAPGGRLYVSVPNVACWEARWPGWNSYEPYHLVYFTPATLAAALTRAGFRVLNAGTHDSFSGWFLTFARSLRGSGAGSGTTGGSPTGALRSVYHLLVSLSGLLSYPLRRLQAALGRGDEIWTLAAPRE
jgi:2-polyprenyl-3-methyl-5-hydroxy-6-metoxy-1,4-benzoquinol methylase